MMNFGAHPVMLVMTVAVIAVLLAEIPLGFRVPVLVLQMVLGMIIGPDVLGFAVVDDLLAWLWRAGVAALFFTVGLELDLERVKGRPLTLAIRGWLASLAVALAAVGLFYELPFAHAPMIVALALTTTALGNLTPILRDAGELKTPFGRMLVAAGAMGEFGPIVAMSLVFTHGHSRWHEIGLMLAFAALAFLAALVTLGLRPPRLLALLERTMHSSAQLPVLLSMLLLFGLVSLSHEFGLHATLGAFAAGMVIGLATRGEAGKPLRVKIEAICFGFLVPFYFVVSGIKFDLGALLGSGKAMLLVPVFLALLLLVRGGPAWFIYRADLTPQERLPFMLYSSMGLSIILAITQTAHDAGRLSAEIASALVGAGLLSVLLFPAIAGKLRARAVLRARE